MNTPTSHEERSAAEPLVLKTNTRQMKAILLGVACLPVVSLAFALLEIRLLLGDLTFVAAITVALSLVLGVCLWRYGKNHMFDRTYVLSEREIHLLHRDSVVERIAWAEVFQVRHIPLSVRAADGRCIDINLPSSMRNLALAVIKERRGDWAPP